MEKAEFFREARRDGDGPLAGVRVLEATTTWAGPMCGCLLADFGADVVKVEHPAGEVSRRSPPFLPGTNPPLSFMHEIVNRNKKNLALDLHGEAGRALFLRLAAKSDVVIENFRPGTLDSWGIGYAAVRAVRPAVIYVSVSGFGQWGPDHDRVGYDPLAQAASGFLSLNGSPDGEPVKSPTFLADDLAGLHAALAALAALRHRDQTGEGQHVDVALLDSMLFQSTGYIALGAMGVDLPRLGNQFRIAAPANCYRCRDGTIFIGILLDPQWRRLAALLGRPELGTDPRYATGLTRIANRDDVDSMAAEWARARDAADALAALHAERIPAAPVRSYAEAAADPHVRAREMLQEVERNGARVPITGPAAKLSRTPIRVRSAARDLGADTEAVLEELGLTREERRALRADGVVAGPLPSEQSD
jgi:crotonobetainyl-CoA:carnitine CoA-transferase CaiB-like acyl-CoA transferase